MGAALPAVFTGARLVVGYVGELGRVERFLSSWQHRSVWLVAYSVGEAEVHAAGRRRQGAAGEALRSLQESLSLSELQAVHNVMRLEFFSAAAEGEAVVTDAAKRGPGPRGRRGGRRQPSL